MKDVIVKLLLSCIVLIVAIMGGLTAIIAAPILALIGATAGLFIVWWG